MLVEDLTAEMSYSSIALRFRFDGCQGVYVESLHFTVLPLSPITDGTHIENSNSFSIYNSVISKVDSEGRDNFYYPPEWTPHQGSLNKYEALHHAANRRSSLRQILTTVSMYVITSGAHEKVEEYDVLKTMELSLLRKEKKAAEPLLVPKQSSTRAQIGGHRKRVARKLGLGIRLPPKREEDIAAASRPSLIRTERIKER